MIRVTVIHSGKTVVDVSMMFEPTRKLLLPQLALLGFMRSRSDKVEIPVSAYLIEHPKGKVLIDTGFHKAVRERPIRELTPLHYLVNCPNQLAGESVDEKLASMGIRPEDLECVVLTHLHSDHVGGVRQFLGAKRFLVSEDEWNYAKAHKLEYVSRLWADVPMTTFSFADTGIGPVGRSFDLFGDETITLVNLPGHTKGLCGVLVHNEEKSLLLTSDCGYARKSWEQMLLPGVLNDREEMIRSLQWVLDFSKAAGCIDCLATHEPELSTMVYEL